MAVDRTGVGGSGRSETWTIPAPSCGWSVRSRTETERPLDFSFSNFTSFFRWRAEGKLASVRILQPWAHGAQRPWPSKPRHALCVCGARLPSQASRESPRGPGTADGPMDIPAGTRPRAGVQLRGSLGKGSPAPRGARGGVRLRLRPLGRR